MKATAPVRFLRPWLWLLLLAAALVPAAAAGADETDELAGTWRLVSYVVDGEDATEKLRDRDITYVIDPPMLLTHYKDDQGEMAEKSYRIAVDAKSTPKQFDATRVIRPEEKSLGIYEVEGDTLRRCFSVKGERPTAFDAGEGTGNVLIVFERVKAEGAQSD